MMEEHMHQIILKGMIRKRLINNFQKKEICVLIFVKYKRIMVRESFLENLNELKS